MMMIVKKFQYLFTISRISDLRGRELFSSLLSIFSKFLANVILDFEHAWFIYITYAYIRSRIHYIHTTK